MKFLSVIAIMLSLTSVSKAAEFTPTVVETTNFKVKTSRAFENADPGRVCKFETMWNERKNVIELRVGVEPATYGLFGWNMYLTKDEWPLKEGFRKDFKTAGTTTMILRYENKSLTFFRDIQSEMWNRIYSFSVDIDPELTTPKKFRGTLQGYETNSFGQPIKHIVQDCTFN